MAIRFDASGDRLARTSGLPVSYTHLDVYKRQDNMRNIRYSILTGFVALSLLMSGAAQTGVVRTALAGAYMRVKLDVAGTLTPTVKATLR